MSHKNILALAGIMVVLCASANAESLSTTDGTTYDNIASKRADPDGLVIEYKLPSGGLGMAKVRFARLSADQQKQYGYDANKAREYEAQTAKATEEWRAEAIKAEQEGRARKAEQLAQENQAETLQTDRIVAMTQLKQAEADLARSSGGGGEDYGGAFGGYFGGGDFGFAIPPTGRVPRAKRRLAPIVAPVPFPRLNTPSHHR